MSSKISMVIEAGRILESHKTGFTVSDLMNTLNWEESERFYLQNAMAQLTRKGKAKKLGSKKPIVYSFNSVTDNGNGKDKNKARRTPATSSRAEALMPADNGCPKLTYEDIAQMEIPLELIGQGVIHLNEQLKLKNQELESALGATKRQIVDAMKRIRDQDATIEEQNRTIANLKRNYKLATKLHSPIIERKKPR
jgi:hypothetical protein